MKYLNLFCVFLATAILAASCSNGNNDNTQSAPIKPLSNDLVALPQSYDSKALLSLSKGMVLYFNSDTEFIGKMTKSQNEQPEAYIDISLIYKKLSDTHTRSCTWYVKVPVETSSPIVNFKAGEKLEIKEISDYGSINGSPFFSRIVLDSSEIVCVDYLKDHSTPLNPRWDYLITIGELKESFSAKVTFAEKK